MKFLIGISLKTLKILSFSLVRCPPLLSLTELYWSYLFIICQSTFKIHPLTEIFTSSFVFPLIFFHILFKFHQKHSCSYSKRVSKITFVGRLDQPSKTPDWPIKTRLLQLSSKSFSRHLNNPSFACMGHAFKMGWSP